MRTGPRLLLGAAGGIAVVTVLARAVGFGRVAVLSRTLGTSCVGDVYSAANALPNIVFEVVAGGALAALVVPLLAAAVAGGDRETVSRTVSALLTWTVAVLVPVAAAGVLAAPALVRAVLGPDPSCEGAVEVGSRMLVVFMPQVVLYGIGIVLAGVLQAHRRFLGPALAPLLSSLVVIVAYLLYAASGRVERLPELSGPQELVLSVGTTLGVAVLSLSLLVPLRSCGLHLRPTWGFPVGVAARVRALAAAGAAGVVAQQVALVVALRLAAGGGEGSVVVLVVATAVFLVPWAVLAVPIATSVFPSLSAAGQRGEDEAYADVLSGALRSVLLATTGAAAVLVVAAPAGARLLVQGAPGAARADDLAAACVAFAPGLVGYGLLALLVRACYARGDVRTPTAATLAGWSAVAVVDVALVRALPGVERVVLLGIGNTVGLTLAGVALVLALRATPVQATGVRPTPVRAAPLRPTPVSSTPADPAAPRADVLRGTGRSCAAALAGAGAALVAGLLVGVGLPAGTPALLEAPLLAAVAAAAFLPVVRLLDPVGLRGLLRA